MRNEAGFKREKRLNLSGLPNIIFTLLICVVCWIVGFYHQMGVPLRSGNGFSLLWETICQILPAGKINLYLIGFCLLCLGAALLQRLNFLFVIIKEKTTLPFLLFLLLNSVNPDFYPLRPVSFVIFPLIFAMFELYSFSQKPKAISRMFNMMVYLGAGSLVWPYLLLFTPVFWIGMYQFRILSVRTLAASLLGLFTVCWFALGWCVWKHDFGVFANIIQCIADIRIIFAEESWMLEWLAPLCIFFFMIILSIHITLLKQDHTIRARNFISFFMLFGVVSFILSLFYAPNLTDFLCVFYLPASIIAASTFSGKQGIVTFLLYYLLMALLILLLFVRLWNF